MKRVCTKYNLAGNKNQKVSRTWRDKSWQGCGKGVCPGCHPGRRVRRWPRPADKVDEVIFPLKSILPYGISSCGWFDVTTANEERLPTINAWTHPRSCQQRNAPPIHPDAKRAHRADPAESARCVRGRRARQRGGDDQEPRDHGEDFAHDVLPDSPNVRRCGLVAPGSQWHL